MIEGNAAIACIEERTVWHRLGFPDTMILSRIRKMTQGASLDLIPRSVSPRLAEDAAHQERVGREYKGFSLTNRQPEPSACPEE
jgi:hypothetical protein